jgi:hypothetical protein
MVYQQAWERQMNSARPYWLFMAILRRGLVELEE